jgi:hypothetical protein
MKAQWARNKEEETTARWYTYITIIKIGRGSGTKRKKQCREGGSSQQQAGDNGNNYNTKKDQLTIHCLGMSKQKRELDNLHCLT